NAIGSCRGSVSWVIVDRKTASKATWDARTAGDWERRHGIPALDHQGGHAPHRRESVVPAGDPAKVRMESGADREALRFGHEGLSDWYLPVLDGPQGKTQRLFILRVHPRLSRAGQLEEPAGG